MNRRGFLSSMIKVGAAFAILPPATTYARIWRAQRNVDIRPAADILRDQIETRALYRPPNSLYDFLVGQRDRQIIEQDAATVSQRIFPVRPAQNFGSISACQISAPTSEELRKLFGC